MRSIKMMASKALFKVKKHSDKICLAGGLIGFGATVVLACRGTMKADEILDKYAAAKDKIERTKRECEEKPLDGVVYTEKDIKRDKMIATRDMLIGMGKVYAPAVGVGIISIGLLLTSYHIVNGRFVSALGALKALDETYKKYRQNVIDAVGEEKEEEIRTGIKKVAGHVKELNSETGETEVVEKENLDYMGDKDLNDLGCQSLIFSRETSASWQAGGGQYNEAFLKAQETYFNQLLMAREGNYVFVAEVKRALGFKPQGIDFLTGWINAPGKKDSVIDFHLRGPIYNETGENVLATGRIVKELSGCGYYIELIPDGVIWNLIR